MRSRCQLPQLLIGIVLGWILYYLHVTISISYSAPPAAAALDHTLLAQIPASQLPKRSHSKSPTSAGFAAAYAWQRVRQNQSLYRFDQPGRLLPLLQVADGPEANPEHRAAEAAAWLRTQSLVIAATVRNAMPGMESSLVNLARLRRLFARSWLLIVENDSTDRTRERLLELARADPSVFVLGCGSVNSAQSCRIDMRYDSGQVHGPGQTINRTMADEVDRGLIMSALRNEYLKFAYKYLADEADLMLMIDPDVVWQDWNLNDIQQGLYYFKTRPQLQQLCANTLDLPSDKVFDPCSLAFFNNKRFGEDTLYPNVDYYKSIHRGPRDLPPVKVESCFQAFAFYRLSELHRARLQYERSLGEWMCEHNTLSRQLAEVYIDPQMRLGIHAANVG